MGPFKHLCFEGLYCLQTNFRLVVCLIGMPFDVLVDWLDYLVFEVLQQSLDEGRSHLLDSALKPNVVVEEVSFACQNSQVNGKVVVLTVYYGNQAFFDLLGNV